MVLGARELLAGGLREENETEHSRRERSTVLIPCRTRLCLPAPISWRRFSIGKLWNQQTPEPKLGSRDLSTVTPSPDRSCLAKPPSLPPPGVQAAARVHRTGQKLFRAPAPTCVRFSPWMRTARFKPTPNIK